MHLAASDLGLHGLFRPVCPNTGSYYSKYIRNSAIYLHAWLHITIIEVFSAVVSLLILKDLFNVLYCNFKVLNLLKSDVLASTWH